MSTVEYSWREGSRVQLDPNVVGQEIDRIYDTYGAITPETLVKEAAKKKSPLHDYFEWDDSVAAVEWRKQQGRILLGSIQIKKVGDTTPKVMNVSIKLDDGSRAYQKADIAVKSISQWEFVLQEAVTYLESAQRRLDDLIAIETNGRRKKVIKARDAVAAAAAEVRGM